MVTLDVGNILLKPSHRRRLMSMLKRIVRIGEKLGQFNLRIALRRIGRHVEMVARVDDRIGTFACRAKATSVEHAMHDLVRDVRSTLHAHRVGLTT